MAGKRRTQSDGAINLDSLMDALTNVVAVLILVLVLVQADVSQKVQKLIDDLLPATPEEIEASKDILASLQERQKVLEAAMRAEAPSPEQIEEEKRQLALLEESFETSTAELGKLEELRKIEKQVRSERELETEATVKIQSEIARLEGLLDETPIPAPYEPAVVNIPNSRAIPDDARIYYAIARNGRIHIIDPHTPLDLFEKEFDKRKKDWLHQRVKVKGAVDKYIYDGQKIAAFFKGYDWKNTRGQQVTIQAPATGHRLNLIITPDLKNGGTPTEELATVGSGFSKAASIISRDFDAVLLFRVSTDSFDTYIRARELADRANIASGWDINGSPRFVKRLSEPMIRRIKEPPPADPNKPKPPAPPPLKPKLD
ncbi:MAG: hypothetical protein AB8D78_04670 [Akkermansiaceae bacterium]